MWKASGWSKGGVLQRVLHFEDSDGANSSCIATTSSVFLSLFSLAPTHLRQVTNYCSAIMSNVRPHGSDNDGPRPHLIIQVDHIISGLAYLSAGRVVTGSFDGTMRIWNVEYGKPEGSSMQHGDRVYRIAATHDRKKLVSSAFFGTIKVWGVESRELIKEWTHPEWKPHIAISPDDRLVAVGNRRVFLHTLEGPGSRQVNQPIKVPGGILCMSFSPNRDKLACGTPDGIRVYNVANGTLVLGPLLPSAKKLSLENRVRGVLWSQNGSRLFSGSDDETIRCWNSNTGEPIGLPWTGHTNWIRALSLSPDGSILASVSANDQTVRFWDSTSGNPIGQPLRHKRRVLAVHFSPSGESVASVGPDKRVYLWRVPRLGTIESQVCIPRIGQTTRIHRSLRSRSHIQLSSTWVLCKLHSHRTSHIPLAPNNRMVTASM